MWGREKRLNSEVTRMYYIGNNTYTLSVVIPYAEPMICGFYLWDTVQLPAGTGIPEAEVPIRQGSDGKRQCCRAFPL